MKSLYSAQGLHLTVHASSVAIPNFWELLLTLHYLTHEIKLTGNMGYYRQQIGTGIYVANEQPYAEFTIVDAGLAKLLDSKDNDNSEKYKASLSLDQRSRKLILRIDGQRHLLKQYRSEKSINYHALLKLYTNTGEPQTRSDLMNPGANTTLNHLPSNIGFRGILREKFIEFGYINSLRALTLHKTIELNKEDYDRLKAELVKNQG